MFYTERFERLLQEQCILDSLNSKSILQEPYCSVFASGSEEVRNYLEETYNTDHSDELNTDSRAITETQYINESNSEEEYEIFKSGPFTETQCNEKSNSSTDNLFYSSLLDLRKETVQIMINMARSRREGLRNRFS